MLRPALTFSLLCTLVCAENPEYYEGPKDEGCPINGWPDYYGSGVRIGIYTVWLSSWLANNFLAEEIIGTLETNSIFLLALFTTVFYFSVISDGIRVIDVIIIHQLCVGFLFSVMSLWGYRTMYYKTEGPGGRRHFGGIGTHFRLVLMTMITAYGVWFWIKGVADGLPDIDRREACGGLMTFFFGPMKVTEWSTRRMQLTISVLCVTYYGIMAIAAVVGVSFYLTQHLRRKTISWGLIERSDSETALTKRELTHWYIAISAFNLFWIFYSMISVEFTLKLNHMQNVISLSGISPGQLIPLLIGIASLLRVSYIIFRNKIGWTRVEEETIPSAEGDSDKKYMKGLGPTVTNTHSTHSPPRKAPPSEAEAIANLPTRRAIEPFRPRRHLLHRFLLAWFPWLSLLSFFHHPIDLFPSTRELPVAWRHSRDIRCEKTRPLRSQNPTVETESPETALLESTPQLQPDQKGLVAASAKTSGEMMNREASYISSGPCLYDGGDYNEYGR